MDSCGRLYLAPKRSTRSCGRTPELADLDGWNLAAAGHPLKSLGVDFEQFRGLVAIERGSNLVWELRLISMGRVARCIIILLSVAHEGSNTSPRCIDVCSLHVDGMPQEAAAVPASSKPLLLLWDSLVGTRTGWAGISTPKCQNSMKSRLSETVAESKASFFRLGTGSVGFHRELATPLSGVR